MFRKRFSGRKAIEKLQIFKALYLLKYLTKKN